LTAIFSVTQPGNRVIQDVESLDVKTTESRIGKLPISMTVVTPVPSEPTGNIEGDNPQKDTKQNPEDPEKTEETEKEPKGELANCYSLFISSTILYSRI
jgi:hypothetical protein